MGIARLEMILIIVMMQMMFLPMMNRSCRILFMILLTPQCRSPQFPLFALHPLRSLPLPGRADNISLPPHLDSSWPGRSRTSSSPRPAFQLTKLHKHPALSTRFPHRPPELAYRPPGHAHRPPEHAHRPPGHANALSAALLQRGGVHPKHTPLPLRPSQVHRAARGREHICDKMIFQEKPLIFDFNVILLISSTSLIR